MIGAFTWWRIRRLRSRLARLEAERLKFTAHLGLPDEHLHVERYLQLPQLIAQTREELQKLIGNGDPT